MDIEEVLNWTDRLVFEKTGKHLDSLQKAVIEGTWQQQKYPEIAKNCNRGHDRIKQVARELWEIMSVKLGENVRQSNVRSILENLRFSNISNLLLTQNSVQKIGNINFCGESGHCLEGIKNRSRPITNPDNIKPETRHDLRDAPDMRTFYDRASCPLSTLEHTIASVLRTRDPNGSSAAIAHENCRLLTITGMSGIGKSAIVRHLIPKLQTQFDRIIWRTLRTSPPLETTLKNLIQSLSNQPEINLPPDTDSQLSILIEYLRDNRCLIILDDVQQILNRGQISGYYKPGYENYGTLFKLIGEIPHNSCLILNSWEPPLDILSFTDDNSAVRLLQLTGLGEAATEILREKGLLDEEKWPELINLYQGNPLWLKLVAQTIKSLFAGRVSQYLSYESLFLSDELTPILQQHYQRLSESEKHAIVLLTHQTEPVSITTLLEYCQESKADLFKAIPSLVRRGLISTNVRRDETVFAVIPVVKEYVKMVGL
jgi:NB-ARC domain